MNIAEAIEKLNSTETDLLFEADMVQLRFMSEVDRLMEENNISKKELATRIGKPTAYLTQLFTAKRRLSFEVIASLQLALGVKFSIKANIE